MTRQLVAASLAVLMLAAPAIALAADPAPATDSAPAKKAPAHKSHKSHKAAKKKPLRPPSNSAQRLFAVRKSRGGLHCLGFCLFDDPPGRIGMIRSVFAATLAAAMLVGPAIALAQGDMVTYSDTLRKKSSAHSAVHPVKRGTVGVKHGAGAHAAARGHRRK
jgi:hypothetical protein